MAQAVPARLSTHVRSISISSRENNMLFTLFTSNVSGRTSFIHGGSNMMFVAESYIIAVVNGVIAFGFIMMADAPKDPTNLNSKCKLMLGQRFYFVDISCVFLRLL